MYSRYPANSCCQQGLLVVDAKSEHHQADNDDQQTPIRAERQRDADHQDHIAEVHRVPDEPVPTRRRQLLAGLDGDIGCGIAVLDRHQHRDGEPDRYQYVSHHRNSCGHRRPPEAKIQGADHNHGGHRPERDGADELLQGSCLRAWAGLHASAQGFGILHRQIDARYQRRGGEHRDERPSLPVVECAGRPEHQQPEYHKPDGDESAA